jgi:hypothetical protein
MTPLYCKDTSVQRSPTGDEGDGKCPSDGEDDDVDCICDQQDEDGFQDCKAYYHRCICDDVDPSACKSDGNHYHSCGRCNKSKDSCACESGPLLKATLPAVGCDYFFDGKLCGLVAYPSYYDPKYTRCSVHMCACHDDTNDMLMQCICGKFIFLTRGV